MVVIDWWNGPLTLVFFFLCHSSACCYLSCLPFTRYFLLLWHIHMQACTPTHACTHAHTHARTHAHTHTPSTTATSVKRAQQLLVTYIFHNTFYSCRHCCSFSANLNKRASRVRQKDSRQHAEDWGQCCCAADCNWNCVKQARPVPRCHDREANSCHRRMQLLSVARVYPPAFCRWTVPSHLLPDNTK